MVDEFEPVLRTPELGPGELREVEAHGQKLVVVNVGQTYYALDAHCPNEGTNLAREGRLRGDLLVCPHDDWAFDVQSGVRVQPDAGSSLRRYAVRIEGNLIKIGPALS